MALVVGLLPGSCGGARRPLGATDTQGLRPCVVVGLVLVTVCGGDPLGPPIGSGGDLPWPS